MTASATDRDLESLQYLEAGLRRLCECVRLLPNLTPENAVEERARLIDALEKGQRPRPDWKLAVRRPPAGAMRAVDALRLGFKTLPGSALYLAKLDELALELALVDAIGHPRRVRPLAARRFGRGHGTPIRLGSDVLEVELWSPRADPPSMIRIAVDGCGDLHALARRLLHEVQGGSEPAVLPADAPKGEPSASAVFRAVALAAGLDVKVRVDPRLAARAACGDRVLFVGQRLFGMREVRRLAAHEVLGHLVAAANARAQPLRLLEMGTADSFVDQEGLAICLEEAAGLLDGQRLRTLAARVLATDWMHDGADFGETVWQLVHEEGFSSVEAVAIAERAYRGGGVARDSGYLLGWTRVREALQQGVVSVDSLRLGRVGLDAMPHVRQLMSLGLARACVHRPNFWRSLSATESGTVPATVPPREAASLTRLELT